MMMGWSTKLATLSFAWTGVNVLTAPLLGWGLAQYNMPSMLALYIMLLNSMIPLVILLWGLARRELRQ
jgi:ABC-type glycerol-3-phosphate transport system permease component